MTHSQSFTLQKLLEGQLWADAIAAHNHNIEATAI